MAHNNKHMRHVWAEAEGAEAVTGHGPDDRWWGTCGSRSRWQLSSAGQSKGHFFLLCWCGSSASESECRRRRLLWGYLLLMTRKLTTERARERERGGLGLQHVPRCVCVMCVSVRVRVCVCMRLLKCFQISRISGQQRQQNDAGSLLTFRRLFVRQIVHRFSSSLFFVSSSFFFLAFHLRHRQTRHINELWSLHRAERMKCILSFAGIMRRNYRQCGGPGSPCHMRSLSLSLGSAYILENKLFC